MRTFLVKVPIEIPLVNGFAYNIIVVEPSSDHVYFYSSRTDYRYLDYSQHLSFLTNALLMYLKNHHSVDYHKLMPDIPRPTTLPQEVRIDSYDLDVQLKHGFNILLKSDIGKYLQNNFTNIDFKLLGYLYDEWGVTDFLLEFR